MYCWEVEQTCGPLVCALSYHWECPSKSKNQVDLCLKALVCFQNSSYAVSGLLSLLDCSQSLLDCSSDFLYTQSTDTQRIYRPCFGPRGCRLSQRGLALFFLLCPSAPPANKGLHLYESVCCSLWVQLPIYDWCRNSETAAVLETYSEAGM